ncbi:MAG TPA: hypothetical protein VGH85_10160 [Mycobacteriales bacterium]
MADQRRYDDGTRPVPAYRDVPPSGLISPTSAADATAPGPVAGPFGDSLSAASALAAPPPAGAALPGSETALDFGRFPDSTRISSPDLAGPPPAPPPPPAPRPAPRPSATPAPPQPPVRRAPVEAESERQPAAAAAEPVEPAEPTSPIQEGDQVHLDPLLYRRVRPRADQRQSGPPADAPWAPPRGTVPWTPPPRPGSPRGTTGSRGVPRLGEPGSGPGPVRPPQSAPGQHAPGQSAPGQSAPGQRGPGRQPARRGARPWWLLIVAAILIFNLARGCGHI